MKKNKYVIEQYTINDAGAVSFKEYKSKRQAKKNGIKKAYVINEGWARL